MATTKRSKKTTVEKELPDLNAALSLISEADWTVINSAIASSGITLAELLRKGLLAESKRINSHAEKLSNIDESQLVGTTLSGAANVRIKNAIAAMTAHNDSCTDRADRIYISPNNVRSATNSNLNAIKKYFADHEQEIEALNRKYNAPESKPRGYDVKATLGLR